MKYTIHGRCTSGGPSWLMGPAQPVFKRAVGPNGFTLIEMIVTLTLAALVATMLFTFMGPAVTRSHEPVDRLEADMALAAVAANLRTRYAALDWDDAAAWGIFTNSLGAEGSSQSNVYGSYTVVERRWITFDALGHEIDLTGDTGHAVYGRYLKLVIANGGQPLMLLLSRQGA